MSNAILRGGVLRFGDAMSLIENIERIGVNLTTAVFGALGAGCLWIIRNVLTNREKVEILEREMRHRQQQRDEDRAALSDVRESVKRIEGWIMERGK